MSRSARPGELFEAQFMASIPPGVDYVKLRAQSPGAFALPAVARHLEQSGPVPDNVSRALAASRFAPRSPYDLEIKAPCGYPSGEVAVQDHLGRPVSLPAVPLQVFCLELKSTSENRLPLDAVEPHQLKGLAKAAAHGQIAGVVIEFREAVEVWFVPVQSWQAFQASTTSKSLPLAVARRIGMHILPDLERGETRNYWRVGDWLAACGAVIPAKEKKARAGKASGEKAPPPSLEQPVLPLPPPGWRVGNSDWPAGKGPYLERAGKE